MDLFATSRSTAIAKAVFLTLLLAGIVAVSQSQIAATDDSIRTAIAIDLLFTFPAAYYLLIRRTSIPTITVAPVFFASYFLASTLLGDVRFLASLAIVLIPAVELGLLGYLGYRVYRTRKTYRSEAAPASDLMERLRTAMSLELKPPAVGRAAAFELAVFTYAFFKWRSSAETGFTYHRRNSPTLLLFVLLFLLAVETAGLHLLLAMWSETLAWIATALSLYVAVQLFAHLKAIRLRPIVITDEHLIFRCGILGDATIARESVRSVDLITGVGEVVGSSMLPVGQMSQPNVRITLDDPATIYGVYGISTTAESIALSLDDPAAFICALQTSGR